MQLQLGTGQEVSIHNVESVKIDETNTFISTKAQDKYFRTMYVKTESGETIEITLFSDDKEVLDYQD
jgi:hypothetical protein